MADTILNTIGNLSECLAWPDAPLCPLADLAMRLSRLAVIREKVVIDVIQMALLFVGRAIPIIILIFNLFALRVVVGWK